MRETELDWVIVTDNGFKADDRASGLMDSSYGEVTPEALAGGLPDDRPAKLGIVIAPGDDVDALEAFVGDVDLVIVPFGSFADGRGFSIATRLRRLGYGGRLRAQGHVIVDQYAHARRCGFDEVAISAEQARRQPESQWLAQVARINTTYQNRLAQAPVVA